MQRSVRVAFTAVLLVGALLAATAATASADSDRNGRSVVFNGRTFVVIPNSFSILHRQDGGLLVVAELSQLTPGDQVQIRLNVFNNPAACAHPAVPPTPNEGLCGPADAANPATEPHLIPGPFTTVDENGKAHFTSSFSEPWLSPLSAEVVLAFRTFTPDGTTRTCGTATTPGCYSSVHPGVVGS